MKTKRQSNIELLRLISMLMIVTMHLVNHSGLLTASTLNKFEYCLVWILFGFGICSINLYLLISGYFLCESKFSVSRVIKLAIQVFTYSFAITMIYWIFTDVEHDKEYLIYSVLPILSDFYWFVSMYIGMYILSPVLNKLVHTLTKKQFQCTLAACLLLISVWPNVIYYSSAMNTAGGVSISWFLTVYLLGAYIRMYYVPGNRFISLIKTNDSLTNNLKHPWAKYLILAVLANLVLPLSKFLFEFLLTTPLSAIPFLDDMLWGYSIFYNYSTIPVTIASLLYFIAFLNIKIDAPKTCAIINLLSASSFGVYLFHDHYYIRESIWRFINPTSWIGHWYLLPMCFFAIIGIYLFGTCIEQIRQLIFKPVIKSERFKKVCMTLDERLKRYCD